MDAVDTTMEKLRAQCSVLRGLVSCGVARVSFFHISLTPSPTDLFLKPHTPAPRFFRCLTGWSCLLGWGSFSGAWLSWG